MKKISHLLIAGLLLSTLAACHEGPAERRGKHLDNAVENVKDAVQDKGPAQKAGERVDDATGQS